MSTSSPRALTYQQLRSATELLARQRVAAGVVDEATVDAHRPGAAGYEEDSVHTWLVFFGWLHEQGHAAPAPDTARVRPLSQVLHEALADTPVPVTLRSGEYVAVYAKSLDTLLWLEALDQDLVTARAQMQALVESAVADDAPAIAQTVFLERLLTGLSLRLFVWTLTTEGPGLPFKESERDPEPPAFTKALQVEDVEALYRAHLQVNREDLAFIASAFPSDARPGSTRLPLSGFMGAMAHEWGIASREVMRGFSVRSLFASAISAGQSAREARAAADGGR